MFDDVILQANIGYGLWAGKSSAAAGTLTHGSQSLVTIAHTLNKVSLLCAHTHTRES